MKILLEIVKVVFKDFSCCSCYSSDKGYLKDKILKKLFKFISLVGIRRGHRGYPVQWASPNVRDA